MVALLYSKTTAQKLTSEISSSEYETQQQDSIEIPSLTPEERSEQDQELKWQKFRHGPILKEFFLHPRYIPKTDIPLIIHQLSKGQDASAFQSIKRVPNALHLIWTDKDLEEFVKLFYPSFAKIFINLPDPIYKVDLGRYMIIHEFGGIYSDMDTILLKNVDVWVPESLDTNHVKLIAGIESDSVGRSDWKKWFARELQFCQWTFASAQKHKVMESVINMAMTRTIHPLIADEEISFNDRVLETTGPGVWTDALFKYFKHFGKTPRDLSGLVHPVLVEDVLVLSITGFSPGLGWRGLSHRLSRGERDPDALVKHNFAGSWRKDKK